MATNLEEFKEFIKRHPLLKLEVKNRNKTWQQIYEDWTILNDDMVWEEYKIEDKKENVKSEETSSKAKSESSEAAKESKSSTEDMIKNAMGYLKKINPDTITKYVGSIQKIVELIGVFGGGATAASAAKKTGDPLFDKKFDEWY